jgi:hypothetical protein
MLCYVMLCYVMLCYVMCYMLYFMLYVVCYKLYVVCYMLYVIGCVRLGNYTTKQRDKNSWTIFVPREELEPAILNCAAANTSCCWLQKHYFNLHAHTRGV